MSKKGGNGQTPYSYRTRYPENGGRERGLRRFLPMWLRRLLRLGRLPPRRPGLDAFGVLWIALRGGNGCPDRVWWVCQSCGSCCPNEDEDDCRFCFARRPAICEYKRIP